MRLVLVGPPGSGKGTQAERLCARYGLAPLGTGALLREAIRLRTPTGLAVEHLLAAGLLAPDGLVNDLVADLFRARRPDRFVMDGYPRTYAQAIAFDALLRQECLALDGVIHLAVPDAEVVRRIGNRRSCANPACAAVYSLVDRPPKVAGACDRCGGPLVLRADDAEPTTRQRLAEYHRNTDALVDHYRRAGVVKDVPAATSADAVFDAITALLP